jgi:hypothetical protein
MPMRKTYRKYWLNDIRSKGIELNLELRLYKSRERPFTFLPFRLLVLTNRKCERENIEMKLFRISLYRIKKIENAKWSLQASMLLGIGCARIYNLQATLIEVMLICRCHSYILCWCLITSICFSDHVLFHPERSYMLLPK